MAENDDGPTLTNPVGLGGVIAQAGFDYQIWEGLLRVPAWVNNPAFEAVIFEGLEDIEARFFAAHATEQRLLERFQAKSGDLGPKEVGDVFARFLEFEQAHPRVARVQTLVTPQLPATLRWIARDAARVRRARPFYAPFPGIRAASDEKLTADFSEQFGEELGAFVAEGVEVTERPMPSRGTAVSAFGSALASVFPNADLGSRSVHAVFNALESLVRNSIGVPISRSELLQILEREGGGGLLDRAGFALHVRSDRNGTNESALEIDASEFSAVRGFPSPERWKADLVVPLDATAKWLRGRDVSRITLTGSYRITTAFVLGFTFRSAVGFELDISTRDGPWATDDRPVPLHIENEWTVVHPAEPAGDTLTVVIGVIRRPSQDLAMQGTASTEMLEIFRSTPIPNAKAAQTGVGVVKATVTEATSRLRPKHIRVYYAGPAAFAVALGHRWNAMLPTTLLEFDAVGRTYTQTATCG